MILVLGWGSLADAADWSGPSSTYSADYFAGFNVVTASDILRHIPGANAQLGEDARGRGGQRRGLRSKKDRILINGKRLAGKSNDAEEYLDRLPASRVLRVEIIDGMVTETESSAGARTINVVTTAGGGFGAWETLVRWQPDLRTSVGGNLSYSGVLRSLNFDVSISTRPWDSYRSRVDFEEVDGIQTEQTLETRERTARGTEFAASARVSLAEDQSLAINLLFDNVSRDGWDRAEIFVPAAGNTPMRIEYSDEPNRLDRSTLEIGGTYEYQLNDASLLQFLFLANARDVDRASHETVFGTDGQVIERSIETRIEDAAETVWRGTWFVSGDSGNAFNIGLEFAVNTLDKESDVFEGLLEPLPPIEIPNADQSIREDRAELFANYSRSMLRTEVRFGLAAEYSEFDQQGSDVSLSRTLSFVKPSINIAYSGTRNWRHFLTFKRDVGQLNFGDFVASIDRIDGEIRAGNPNLRPETSWDLEVGSEYHFSDGAGLVKLRILHRWIKDVKDLIPLGVDDSQPGNLPRGRHWGVRLNLGSRLDFVGLDNAVVNAYYNWQNSRVIDPFTGQSREISHMERYDAGVQYRHDIEWFRGAYGFTWSVRGKEYRFDFDRIDIDREQDEIRVFVERRLGASLVLTLSANQVYEPVSTRTRINYDAGRASDIPTSIVHRSEVRWRSATLNLSGTF